MTLSIYEQLSPLLLEHFDHPQNAGVLNEHDPQVITVQVQTPAGDEQIQFQLHVNTRGVIDQVAWLAQASSTTMACCSWFSAWVLNKKLEQLQQFKVQELISALTLPKVRYNSAILIDVMAKKMVQQK